MKKDLDRKIEFLRGLTKEAGKILLEYFNSGSFYQRPKEGVDIVTQADLEVDKFLRDRLRAEFPGSNFLTEETAPDDYSHMAELENLWVIDPLDGTINFSRGFSDFCISVALLDKGEVQLGVIHAPTYKEQFYEAQADKEEALLNGKQIHISQTSELEQALLACDWAWSMDRRKQLLELLPKIATKARHIKFLGSAVLALASLATGKIDAYIHTGLKPWDVAAAGFIVQKAGGLVTKLDGNKWTPFEDDILASNQLLYKKILEII